MAQQNRGQQQPSAQNAGSQDPNKKQIVAGVTGTEEQPGSLGKSNVQGPQMTTPQGGKAGGNLAQRDMGPDEQGDETTTRGKEKFAESGANMQQARIDDRRGYDQGVKMVTPKGYVRVRSNPQTGELITESKSPSSIGWVNIGVYQNKRTWFNGISRVQTRTALLKFPSRADAEVFLKENNLKHDTLLAGQVYEEQSFEPFWETQQPVVYPASSNFAGQVVLKDGKPYYRNTQYTDNLEAKDIILQGRNMPEGAIAKAVTAVEIEDRDVDFNG